MSAHETTQSNSSARAVESLRELSREELEQLVRELDRLRAEAESERDRMTLAYRNAKLELLLLRRRIFAAQAERLDTTQLEFEFAAKLAELPPPPPGTEDEPPRPERNRSRPTGRRNLDELDLPEERIEITDPGCEGTAERIGVETTTKIMWRHGSYIRLVIDRVKYKHRVDDGDGPPAITTAPMPPEMIDKSFATPSLLSQICTEKFDFGLPLFRQERRCATLGFELHRSTMCRWLEETGGTVGSTIVFAMHLEMMQLASIISCDATGIRIQPERDPSSTHRRACRRGHIFVLIGGGHVVFDYRARENSAAVADMFHGYQGRYVQVDGKNVFDVLFRPPQKIAGATPLGDEDQAEHSEVGCWSHARRKVWECAITTKDPVAREGMLRIHRIFELEGSWCNRSPDERFALRDRLLRPHIDAYFAFITAEYERVRHQRGLLRSALGYSHRQRGALCRFLEDGRLEMTNNDSERKLRAVATGRKNWLFVGSDDHGDAAAAHLSLVASARLHGLDPQAYVRDVFRVLPQWPASRYIELAPKYWTDTRARLDPDELRREVGWLTIPPPTEKPPPS